MATFGTPVRIEYKRTTVSVTGGVPQTVLSVPSSSNYFIFINQILAFDGSNNILAIQQLRDTTSGVSDWQNNFVINVDSFNATEYLDFYNNVGSASGAAVPGSPPTYTDGIQIKGFGAWAERILHPRKRLHSPGGSTGQMEIYYQEVYFGGVFNY